VVSLETEASLSKPIRLQWEGNPFIKNAMLILDVLDLNGAKNTVSKLCELAAQCASPLTLFSERSK
jgi:hypothetical protein